MSGGSAQWMQWIAAVTGAKRVEAGERVQSLWSGYGEIRRMHLKGAPWPSVIVKHVAPPAGGGAGASHPRGFGGDRSHARKLRSYAVEQAWYRDWAARCNDACRVPRCLGAEETDEGWRFVLEDLDAAGYPGRRGSLRDDELDACLRWLASFHARFLGETPEGLWPVGTYWHLGTRPDELAAMDLGELRDAAGAIDARLRGARFQTLVHGDAKVANFCFPERSDLGRLRVAAVDFQYVGGGCGMKDVAYFLGSCLTERQLARRLDALLDGYFGHLRAALRGSDEVAIGDHVEAEWRDLYKFAVADFERFLAGWAPGHHKRTGQSARLTSEALAAL